MNNLKHRALAEKNNKGGAPTKYQRSFAAEAKRLCLLGCNDKELANYFEVSVSTLNKWKLEHPEFSESLRGGKMEADAKVAAKLYKRAIGFFYDEITFEKISLERSLEDEEIKVPAFKKKVVRKYVLPDVGAQTLWLKNRHKTKWREKFQINFEDLTDEQLNEIIDRIMNKNGSK